MATRFAVKTGNWSDTTLWDNGALPSSSDDIHANGFTITIDQDITVGSLRNNISPVTIPNIATPAMTSNTQPSGNVISSNSSGTAYYAFNQISDNSFFWSSGVNNTGWLGYQFPSGKIIKRYIWKIAAGQSSNGYAKTWTFEGSNDGSSWTVLDTVTNSASSGYTSVLLANTTSYTYYRINVTAAFSSTTNVQIGELEMTEATTASPVYGTTTGGSFAVPSTLSGSINIVQSGDGIVSNGINTVVTTANTTGNTVNFNVTGSGVIFNSLWMTNQSASFRGISCNGTGTVNFNGDIQGNTTTSTSYTQGGQIYISAAGTVNINGNLIAPLGNSTNYQVNVAAAAILNITGNLIGSTLNSLTYNVYSATNNATINITGNLTSNIGPCVYSTSNIFVNIPTGTITVTNASSSPAIVMTGLSSLLTLNSPIINKANANAVAAYKMRFYSTGNPYWVVQNTSAADITLAYGSATGAYPAEADVRFGVTYAASPTRTGTCRVPLPQYVSQGVLVDATVGTAYINVSDVWNVLTSTISTSGSIGERLKNTSTVQTTGDQIAAFTSAGGLGGINATNESNLYLYNNFI